MITNNMKLEELQTFLETELVYAIDQTDVLEQIGSIEIGAPGERENETIESIIGSAGQETYHSAGELFETIIGNVSDEYIGRKFYDDRGGNPVDAEDKSGNVSF
jgi:hypothetical protein